MSARVNSGNVYRGASVWINIHGEAVEAHVTEVYSNRYFSFIETVGLEVEGVGPYRVTADEIFFSRDDVTL